MKLTIAAIRSGSEPLGPLPGGALHRWLDPPVTCPYCAVTYNLVTDWDRSQDRFFASEARPLIQMLRKAVMMGHGGGHQASHFETGGVTVRDVSKST